MRPSVGSLILHKSCYNPGFSIMVATDRNKPQLWFNQNLLDALRATAGTPQSKQDVHSGFRRLAVRGTTPSSSWNTYCIVLRPSLVLSMQRSSICSGEFILSYAMFGLFVMMPAWTCATQSEVYAQFDNAIRCSSTLRWANMSSGVV
jgi:hypothetical protein